MRVMPYLRSNVGLNITFPQRDDYTLCGDNQNVVIGGYADRWHRDTLGLVQTHMLLKDTTMDDPHMLFASGSPFKTFHKLNGYCSEEYVLENFQIIHCIGKKGTTYLFDGSRGLHRMYSRKDRLRMTADVHFTPGNNNLASSCPIENIENIDKHGLNEIQKEALKYFIEHVRQESFSRSTIQKQAM